MDQALFISVGSKTGLLTDYNLVCTWFCQGKNETVARSRQKGLQCLSERYYTNVSCLSHGIVDAKATDAYWQGYKRSCLTWVKAFCFTSERASIQSPITKCSKSGLWALYIQVPFWHWFKSYLAERSHCASVNMSNSSHLPAGSCSASGKLLFLIYVYQWHSAGYSPLVYLNFCWWYKNR